MEVHRVVHHEDRVWFLFLISHCRLLAGEVWGLAWLLTMHTSSPGATITGPGPAIQETLALTNRERGREGEGKCQQTKTLLKNKTF